MKGKALSTILLLGLMSFFLMACGAEQPIDVAAIPGVSLANDTNPISLSLGDHFLRRIYLVSYRSP